MLHGGTGWTGEMNFDRRNRVDWTAECCLEEEGGLESGMLTVGKERTGGRNFDWKNRADWKSNVDWRNGANWIVEF